MKTLLTVGFFSLLLIQQPGQAQSIPLVEPDQLVKNPDLIGRTVVVDDRVRFFLSHKGPNGKEIYDELYLKRTDVVFKLPAKLRTERAPRERVARVQGILQKEGRVIFCEVESLELLPPDMDRLENEVSRLAPKDMAGRKRWAEWAARRGLAFNDADLISRAQLLETEILLDEAEQPNADLIQLAKVARAKRLGEPLASGLAQKGFRARLLNAKTAAELSKLAEEVDAFFPNAADPKVARADGLEDWQKRFDIRPIEAYRQAPAPIRAALDRKLYADIVQQRLERQAGEEPAKSMALSEEARQALSDRPEVASKLRDRALASTEAGASSLRLSEVEELARTFKADGQPERARTLIQRWLDDQRKRLSASDADGRILLASHYDRLLSDRNTAVAVLREAVKIDPNSREAADAFRRIGYRKSSEGEWVDSRANTLVSPASQPTAGPAMPSQPAAPSPSEESLRGLTPEQVRTRFGSKPDKVALSVTQNETIEQWIYKRAKGMQVINFRRPRGQGRPQVISSYSLP